MCVYIYIYTHHNIYIYTSLRGREREREKERERDRERKRETEREIVSDCKKQRKLLTRVPTSVISPFMLKLSKTFHVILHFFSFFGGVDFILL